MSKEQQPKQPKTFSGIPRILNAGLAGIVGVTCVFPLDLVKTRLQNQRIGPNGELEYSGIRDCARKTWSAGGASVFAKIRGLYSGSAVNLVLITPEKAIKLVANDFFRYHLAVPGQKKLSTTRGALAGAGAGALQIVITTPMELLKIQLQDQGRTGGLKQSIDESAHAENGRSDSDLDSARLEEAADVRGEKKMTAIGVSAELLRKHGIAGLYKGLGPTFCRDVTFSAIYFPLFAFFDSLGPRKKDGSGDAVFWTSFCAGMTAGAIASFSVTPLDVAKTRIQTIRKKAHELVYKNVAQALYSILRTEGVQALFKGAACRVMAIAPLFAIAQTVYYVGVAEKILGMKKATHV